MAVNASVTMDRVYETVAKLSEHAENAEKGSAYSVLAVGIQLSKAMPVNRCAIVLKLVANGNLEGITPVANNRRPRKLAVDEQADPRLLPIRVAGCVGNAEVICLKAAVVLSTCLKHPIKIKSSGAQGFRQRSLED